MEFVLAIALYLIPTIIVVARRNAPSAGSVIVVNIFLGWTVIGWIVALAMAVRSAPPPVVFGSARPQVPPYGYYPPQLPGGDRPGSGGGDVQIRDGH